MNQSHRCSRGKPKKETLLNLFVRSGGRCALCNRFLLDNQRSWSVGNFAEVAHVIASSNLGPRAAPHTSRATRDSLSNLILLCPTDHKEVDDNATTYTKELLYEKKREHESRIQHLTNLAGKPPTLLIRCQVNIGGQIVRFSVNDFIWALESHCPIDPEGLELDFTTLTGDESPLAIREKAKEIDAQVKHSLRPTMNRRIQHVSVFAIGPIPLLIQLGNSIGSSVSLDFYQKDRSKQSWKWPLSGKPITFKSSIISKPKKPKGIAFALSISGLIRKEDLPSEIKKSKIVINIKPKNTKPHPGLLTRPDTIQAFISEYSKQKAFARARFGMTPISILPAVPPSIAIAIGSQIFPKADPKLDIFDFRKPLNKFIKVLTI